MNYLFIYVVVLLQGGNVHIGAPGLRGGVGTVVARLTSAVLDDLYYDLFTVSRSTTVATEYIGNYELTVDAVGRCTYVRM